jgi:hypothetical protein
MLRLSPKIADCRYSIPGDVRVVIEKCARA